MQHNSVFEISNTKKEHAHKIAIRIRTGNEDAAFPRTNKSMIIAAKLNNVTVSEEITFRSEICMLKE